MLVAIAGTSLTRVFAQASAPRASTRDMRGDDPGLLRFESALEQQLARGKDALPLPWRETILKPDTARLVWRPRTLPSPAGAGGFRAAIDPPTRWYYVAWTGGAGAPLTLYGPLEEGAKGAFVDALTAAAPAASALQPSTQAAKKPSGKSKSEAKPKPRSTSSSKSKATTKTR